LRTNGFDGRVVLLGEEAEHPYDRPPLSKDYLQGKSERDKIFLHPHAWYADRDIELRLGVHASAVDRDAHQVRTAGGERIGYDKLLLATGSSPRRLKMPGADLGGVLYLRRLGDCEAMKAAFAAANRVAIIGAGWIGLETAAAARAAGCEVTVIERAELPLLAVLGKELAEIYAALHRRHGVQFRFGAELAKITGRSGAATGLRLGDGSLIERPMQARWVCPNYRAGPSPSAISACTPSSTSLPSSTHPRRRSSRLVLPRPLRSCGMARWSCTRYSS